MFLDHKILVLQTHVKILQYLHKAQLSNNRKKDKLAERTVQNKVIDLSLIEKIITNFSFIFYDKYVDIFTYL